MLRNTLLALAATAGLIGGTELGGNTAQAQTGIRVGVAGKNGSISVGIGNGHGYGNGPGWNRPGRVINHYPPRPPVFYSPPPLIVAQPVAHSVYYRGCAHDPWVLYGTFATHFRAQEACDYLRYRGLEVYETAR